MDKKQLLATLKQIAARVIKTQEKDHDDADEALVEFIDDLAITEAYSRINKRYS